MRSRMKKRLQTVLLFFIGFEMAIIFDSWIFNESVENIDVLVRNRRSNIDIQETHQNRLDNRKTAMANVKKIRILCYVDTAPVYHTKRAVHALETWGSHCDKIVFASTLTDINLGAIGLNVTDHHDHIWGKNKLMMQYVYKNFINYYDWFYKCDDDTYVIAENLRYLLASYSPDDPIYFGHKFNWTDHKWGYFAGGSGYAMSNKALRIFVEKILTEPKLYRGKKWPRCHLETGKRIEDMEMSFCLNYYNIRLGDPRDAAKRERFFVHDPAKHLFPELDPGVKWYYQRQYYWSDDGLDCCSNYSISFHYVGPKRLYTLYYLTYRLQRYGIEYQFPAPARKKPFEEIVDILDQETVNKTLRGY